MKNLSLLVLLLVFVGTASATTIAEHNVTVDLETSQIQVDVKMEDMTSSAFYYTSSFPAKDDLTATVNGQPQECDTEPLPPGTYITCDVDEQNFTIQLQYTTEGLVTERSGVNIFRYSQGIQRPTDSYRLKALLPQGSGLVEGSNVSLPVISPETGVTGSDGQRIFVTWEADPSLGQLNFHAIYRPSSESESTDGGLVWLIPVVLVSVLIGAGYLVYVSREEIESAYEELSEDEAEVLDMLRDHDNAMLQKDIVEESEYSKAKISSVISDLEEKGIIRKSKEGRSNKIAISRKYKR